MKKLLWIMVLFTVGCGLGSKNTNTASTSNTSNDLSYLEVPETAEHIIVAAHEHNVQNHNHQAMLVFKDFVENQSNGKIGVKIYPNGQLVANVNEGISALTDGTIDLFHITGSFATYWEPVSVFDLPYMFEDDRLAEAVFDNEEMISKFRQGILTKMPSVRLLGIANSSGWRNFATTKKQIKTPVDVKGLKLRTVPSKVQQELVSLLGGAPTPIPFSETYVGLSTGVVDGTKNGILDIITMKLNESVKYLILDRHAYMAAYWFMNNKKFNSLPTEYQNLVNDGFYAMKWYLASYPKRAEVAAYAEFRKTGGVVYQPTSEELQMFKSETVGMKEWLISEYGEDVRPWLELYENTIKSERNKINVRRQSEAK